MMVPTILGAGAMTALLALGGLGGLGLTVRLSSRRLGAGDKRVAFLLWGPLFVATLALALAHLRIFSVSRLLGVAAIWGAFGAWCWRAGGRRTAEPAVEPGYGRLFWAGWLAVLTLAGFLATPANRYLGAWDTGVYVGTAMEVARSGSLEVRDSFLAELPEAERDAFMHEREPPRRAWHAGFLITDAATGRLMPEFYHLYPSWLAVWAALFGLEGVWAGQTVMALVALGMVMLAGASLFGRGAALLGGLALLACAAQAYAMKITSAEMITQFCLFGGIWALDRVLRTGRGSGGLAATAAVAWAGAVLAHGTAVLPVAAGLTFLFAHALAGRRDAMRWGTFAAIAACAGLAVVWNGLRADGMTRFLAALILAHPAWWCGAAALGGLLVAAGVWRAGRWSGGAARTWPAWVEQGAPVAIVGALLVFGYAVRPVLFPGREAQNVRYFVMLTGWLGSGLAICFLGWRRVRDWPAGQQAFVFMGLATTLVLLVNKMAKPFYLWGSRRWVELALPAVFLLAAVVVVRMAAGWNGKRRFGFGASAAGLCAVVWLGLLAPRASLVYRTREYAGVPDLMAQAAETVRDADRVFCDHWDTAAVLRYVHGIPAWGLTRLPEGHGLADAQIAVRHLRRWAEEGKRVYWIGGWFADPSLRLMKAGDFELETTLVEQREDRLPERAVGERRRLTVYRVTREGEEILPGDLTMGYSAMGLVDGFSGLRQAQDGQGQRFGYRRTRGRGQWYAPRIPGGWRIRLANENPKKKTMPVTLLADGVKAAEWNVAAGWADYTFEMPAGSNRVSLLELISPTYRSGKMRVGVGVAGMNKKND